MRKYGNEEMTGDYRVLDMCYHLVQCLTIIYLLVGCHSDDQFHISSFHRAGSRARLGTGRVKGPKARSLD